MRVLGAASFGDVLAEWGIHEIDGRFTDDGTVPPGFLDRFPAPDRRIQAIGVILQARLPVIAALFAAAPTDCVRVDVSGVDLSSILTMGAKSLTDYNREKLAERSKSADWVRRLAAAPENIRGPMIAIARRPDGPMTLFDGMHRMAAWVAHLSAGRDYPVTVYVVVTRDTAPMFELPG